MSQKSVKTAAELESMITAELREHPECEKYGVEGDHRRALRGTPH